MDCIFCKIASGEIPSHKVFEDDNNIAFLELHPSAPGHLMVISKKHGLSILDYTETELGKLMVAVQIVADKLKKAMNSDSITIGINHLEKRGVPHLHIHLVPRWDNDKGGIIQSIVKNPPKEDPTIITEKIKNS